MLKKLIIFVIFNLYKTKIGFQIKLTSEKKNQRKNNGENNALKFLTRSSTQTNRPLKEARKKKLCCMVRGRNLKSRPSKNKKQ